MWSRAVLAELAVLVLASCAPPASTVAAGPGVQPLQADDGAVAALVPGSECARRTWKGRGAAPAGYVKGMALAYAKSYREMRDGTVGAASAMGQPIGPPATDALALYGLEGATPGERLRDVYALGIGLGMRESSGTPTEGRDTTAEDPSADTAEAGLFQTSFNSMRQDASLPGLWSAYHADPGRCRTEVFGQRVPIRAAPAFGAGPGAEYQTFTRMCPAFAAEYAMVMLRVDRMHFGPINQHEAEFVESCRDLLGRVEAAGGLWRHSRIPPQRVVEHGRRPWKRRFAGHEVATGARSGTGPNPVRLPT